MSSSGLPSGWEVRHSNSKNLPYYFSPETKESRWEPPAGTNPDLLKVYMAQHHSTTGTIRPESVGSSEGKIRAAHLLVKHRDSRRPASWRQTEITRSKEEALQIIRKHQAALEAGETTLQELATTESDCSSARKHGDLGFFGRGEMQKPFENAAFQLKPGGISDVVETDSGVHLIQRLE